MGERLKGENEERAGSDAEQGTKRHIRTTERPGNIMLGPPQDNHSCKDDNEGGRCPDVHHLATDIEAVTHPIRIVTVTGVSYTGCTGPKNRDSRPSRVLAIKNP